MALTLAGALAAGAFAAGAFLAGAFFAGAFLAGAFLVAMGIFTFFVFLRRQENRRKRCIGSVNRSAILIQHHKTLWNKGFFKKNEESMIFFG
jgi:hypothetical protein